jgi:hypothetical protein
MKYTFPKLASAVLTVCMCSQVHAQETAKLDCRGVVGDVPAILSGVRQFRPYNALGDGYVKFAGTVSAGGIFGRITYEGYTRTMPYSGVITTPQGALTIGILDDTGGQMIIYGGRPSIGPPNILGRFICRWN